MLINKSLLSVSVRCIQGSSPQINPLPHCDTTLLESCLTLLISLPLLALGPLSPLPVSVSGSRSSSVLSRPCKFPHLIPVPFPLASRPFSALHLPFSLCPQIPYASVPLAFALTFPISVSVSFSVSLRHQRGQPGRWGSGLGNRILLFVWLQDTFVKVQLFEKIKDKQAG